MTPEQMHQLYGGDLADYITPLNSKSPAQDFDTLSHDINDNALANIYNSQVKTKGAIDTSNIYINRPNFNHLIERQPDKLQQEFQNKINEVADLIGLTDEPGSSNSKYTPTLRDQSVDDVQVAKNLVAQAIDELKNLGAL